MIRPIEIDCPRCNGTGVTFLARMMGRRTPCTCAAGQQIAAEPTDRAKMRAAMATVVTR